MKRSELIRNCLIFSELENSAIKGLSAIIHEQQISRDEMLFAEGDDASDLYILAEGEIELTKSSPDGKEQLIRTVRAGETFGEAAMFAGDTYPATATAKRASAVLALAKKDFIGYIKAHPEVSLKMMGAMAKLLRHLNRLVAELSLGSVQSRLAGYLMKRYKKDGKRSFMLGIKKRELAFKLGTISETLSRTLKKFKTRRLIDVQGERITILDPDAIELLMQS